MNNRLYIRNIFIARLQDKEHLELLSKINDLINAYEPIKELIMEEFNVFKIALYSEEMILENYFQYNKRNGFTGHHIARRATDYAWQAIRDKINPCLAFGRGEKHRDFILSLNACIDHFNEIIATPKRQSQRKEKRIGK